MDTTHSKEFSCLGGIGWESTSPKQRLGTIDVDLQACDARIRDFNEAIAKLEEEQASLQKYLGELGTNPLVAIKKEQECAAAAATAVRRRTRW